MAESKRTDKVQKQPKKETVTESPSETKSSEEVTFRSLGVCEPLCEAVKLLGWGSPTAIQREALPWALKGRDIIGLAQTGSGKTAAFGLPILQNLMENPQPYFALIISPTRELAIQISEQLNALGSGIGVKCTVIIGGMDNMQQSIALAKKPHILICTPGRLLYHLENTKGFSLKNLQFLVLDEADRLLEMDFETELDTILRVIPKKRSTYLFSATMTSKVAKLQRASVTNPVKLEVSSKYSTVSTLQQNYVLTPAKHKECYLVYLLNEFSGNTIIVFVTACRTAQKLTIMTRQLGFQSVPIYGTMTQTKRIGALNSFKATDKNILFATPVASRGLDIPSVDIVINFELPLHSKDYIHQVGRTARAGRSGRSITLVTQYDVEAFQKVEALIGKKMDLFPTEEESVLSFMEKVNEATRIATLEMQEKDVKSKVKRRDKGSKDGKRKQNDDDDADDDLKVHNVEVFKKHKKK